VDKEYGLYLSYNRWLHGIPLDVFEYCEVADATGMDPAELDEEWEEGGYPQDGEIFTPASDDTDITPTRR